MQGLMSSGLTMSTQSSSSPIFPYFVKGVEGRRRELRPKWEDCRRPLRAPDVCETPKLPDLMGPVGRQEEVGRRPEQGNTMLVSTKGRRWLGQ